LKWLLGITKVELERPSRDVEIADYVYIPNMISLSDQIKSCLEVIGIPYLYDYFFRMLKSPPEILMNYLT